MISLDPRRTLQSFLVIFWLAVFSQSLAHPLGSMIFTGEHLLWTYICPLDDSNHYACIMAWDEDAGVRPWLISAYSASDWLMAVTTGPEIYLLERRYHASRDLHQLRLLKALPLQEPELLWDWFDDHSGLGQGGFMPLPDGSLLFSSYPQLYTLQEAEEAQPWPFWKGEVTGLRGLIDGNLLLHDENNTWLINQAGEILQHWPDLLEETTGPLPFMGNRIFDSSYAGGKLWLAYWGQRRIDLITEQRQTLFQFEPPFLPHAIAADTEQVFFLASSINPGEPIRPQLWQLGPQGTQLIWDGL